MENKNLSNRVVHGLFWITIEKWTGRLLGILVFAILGRLLAPADFGIAAIVVSVIAITAVFVDSGLAQALIQRDKLSDVDADSAFWMSAAVGLTLYAILLALTPLLAAMYQQPRLNSLLPIAGLSLPIAGLASVPAALLERNFEFKSLAMRKTIGALVGAAVATAVALNGGGVWALVIQPVAGSLAGGLILWAVCKWRPRLRCSWASLSGMLTFSAQVISIELLNAFQSNVDKFIVGLYFSPTTLGFYYLGQRILTIIMDVVSAVLEKISLTTFSKLQSDRKRLISYFTTLTFSGATIAFAAFSVTTGFGRTITELVFGNGWNQSAALMILMAPSAMLASISYFDKSALLATGHGKSSLAVALGQFVFGIIVLLMAVPFGIYAVAAARSLRQILYWPIRLWTLHKCTGISIPVYLRKFLGPAAGAVVVFLIAFGMEHTAWAVLPWRLVTYLLPASLLCMTAYALIVYLTSKSDVRLLVDALSRFASKRKEHRSSAQ